MKIEVPEELNKHRFDDDDVADDPVPLMRCRDKPSPCIYSACTVVLVVVLSQQPKSGPKQPLDKEQGQTVEKEVDVVHVLVRYQRLFILFLIWQRGKIKKETTLFSKNFYLMF